MSTPSAIEFTVEPTEAGTRLDRALVQRVDGMTRLRARELCEAGNVRVNGRRCEKSVMVRVGDQVSIQMPDAVLTNKQFEALPDTTIPLQVMHEDDDLVVVDKPAGMPSHPLKANEFGTLANALIARYPEMRGVGYSSRDPGLLHRLDNDTSGLLIAVKNAESFARLREALQEGQITKRYTALVEGWVTAPRRIDLALAQHPKDKKRVVACLPTQTRGLQSRAAVTDIEKSEFVGSMSLVELSASPALRHQVRVHLATIGHPLAGDRLYGGPAVDGLTRHFLHASFLSFAHPRTGETVSVRSDLPTELSQTVRAVRKG